MVKARMKCLVDILDRRSALFKIPKIAFDANLTAGLKASPGGSKAQPAGEHCSVLTPNIKRLIITSASAHSR